MKKQAAKEFIMGGTVSVLLWLFGIVFSSRYILKDFVGNFKLYYLMFLFPFLVFGAFVLLGRLSAVSYSGRLLISAIVCFVFIAAVGPFVACAQTIEALLNRFIVTDSMEILAYGYLSIPIFAGVILGVRMANN